MAANIPMDLKSSTIVCCAFKEGQAHAIVWSNNCPLVWSNNCQKPRHIQCLLICFDHNTAWEKKEINRCALCELKAGCHHIKGRGGCTSPVDLFPFAGSLIKELRRIPLGSHWWHQQPGGIHRALCQPLRAQMNWGRSTAIKSKQLC